MSDSARKTRRPTLGPAGWLLAGTTAALLAGCAPLVVGGAVVGGSLMAADRRTSGAQIEDQAIELKAPQRITETIGGRGHVNVTSYNRMVLLTGEVPTDADRRTVEETVSKLENVRSVVNELAVMPASTMSSRSNDSIITTKVKAGIVDTPDLLVNTIKVLTERGTVYLMGRVTEREATRAAEVARSVGGVQKVVRVFEIISEAERASMQPSQAPASPTPPR